MRGKRGLRALLAVLPLLGLTGCRKTFDFLPYARELEDMALIRTMGVDAAGPEGVSVTVSSGEQSDGVVLLQKEAGTISGACLSMQGEGASYIFYGHVGQLLLGEDLARRGIGPALDYVLRDIEMRLETDVYLLRDAGAGEAVRAAAETGSATRRLEAMEADGGLLSYSMARSVEDALEDLEENGCTFLPSLILSGADRTMEADGYGLIRAGKLAGWASGEAARGVNLLQGQVDADILELPGPGREPIALRIVEAETQVEPIFEADELTGLSVVCRVEANLAESGGKAPDLAEPAAREPLERALEERTETRLRDALTLSQTLGGDFFHLENRAARAAPWNKRRLEEQWDLSRLELRVRAEGTVRRGYDIRNKTD